MFRTRKGKENNGNNEYGEVEDQQSGEDQHVGQVENQQIFTMLVK